MVQDNVLYAFVGKTLEPTEPATEGQVALETAGGNYVQVIGTDAKDTFQGVDFRVVRMNQWGILEKSPWLNSSGVISYSNDIGVAPVQCVRTLTIPSAGVEKDELYTFWVVVKDSLSSYGNQSMMKSAVYKTVAATEAKGLIGDNLIKSWDYNMLREPEKYIVAELRSAAAGAAIGAAADTVVGLKGSKTVTVTDTGGDTSVTAITAGDYLRIGTAVTDEIYYVTASTVTTGGGTLTLNRPLVAALSLVGTTAEFCSAASVASAALTIVFTGVARTNFDASI